MTPARVLIVDDDAQIRRVLRTTLVVQGYQVADASSGGEALQVLDKQRFDLVILDMNMPGMTGVETCQRIRALSDVAIVMLTVRDSETDKVMALDAGADDYITKPFSMSELLARARAALRRLPNNPTGTPQLIRAGEVEIDLATRRVRVREKTVRLTPKEFDLLRYLALQRDVPVPHMRLLQAIWGPEYGDEVEYLRVFINQLRKKIEVDPASPRILITEPWLGYRFQG